MIPDFQGFHFRRSLICMPSFAAAAYFATPLRHYVCYAILHATPMLIIFRDADAIAMRAAIIMLSLLF